MINSRKFPLLRWLLSPFPCPPLRLPATMTVTATRGRTETHQAPQQVIMPEVYRQACGDCHMAYPAALLPHRSWVALLDGLDDHFGTVVALDAQQAKDVATYLGECAADRAGGN